MGNEKLPNRRDLKSINTYQYSCGSMDFCHHWGEAHALAIFQSLLAYCVQTTVRSTTKIVQNRCPLYRFGVRREKSIWLSCCKVLTQEDLKINKQLVLSLIHHSSLRHALITVNMKHSYLLRENMWTKWIKKTRNENGYGNYLNHRILRKSPFISPPPNIITLRAIKSLQFSFSE